MRIVLISPKGPLYRRRGGIFKQTLRYMPLTLPTLASLVPDELDADDRLRRRGHRGHRHRQLRADLVGMTVITGTAPRAYELAARIPSVAAFPSSWAAPTSRWCPTTPNLTRTASSWATPRKTWPRLLRDFVPRPHEARGTRRRRTWISRTGRWPNRDPSAAAEIPDRRRLRGHPRLHPQL